MRIGKKEGMNTTNVAKRQVQNVWVKDKLDTQYPGFCILCVYFDFCVGVLFLVEIDSSSALRSGWFVHENVMGYPKQYLSESCGSVCDCQETQMSPQRFGKPMNRHATVSKDIRVSFETSYGMPIMDCFWLLNPEGFECIGSSSTAASSNGEGRAHESSLQMTCSF